MSVQEMMDRLASEVTAALEAKRAKFVMRKPDVHKKMGINTTSMYGRRDRFWYDLAAFCDEFWSTSIQWKTSGFGHLAFSATGAFGTRLDVLMTTGSDYGTVDTKVTVTKGANQHTTNKAFGGWLTIDTIVYAIDKLTIDFGRKWE